MLLDALEDRVEYFGIGSRRQIQIDSVPEIEPKRLR